MAYRVEGWFYPALWQPGGPLHCCSTSTVVRTGCSVTYSIRSPRLLRREGVYGVLAINPRGSAGYGQRFSDGKPSNWGGGDYEDLMAGVDHVPEKPAPTSSRDRLAVTGRSYGGFMTNWVITQTDRFKAAVAVASVANLISFYGDVPVPGPHPCGVRRCIPGTARTSSCSGSGRRLRMSETSTTPTLFVHGEQNNDVHVTEPEAMYMGLRRTRRSDSAFARYPREGQRFLGNPNTISMPCDERWSGWTVS